MEKLFLNPYVSVLEINNKIYIKSFEEHMFEIQRKVDFKYLLSKSEFTTDELSTHFSHKEIEILKKCRLILNDRDLVPSSTGMLSRQRGLFSIISPNYKLFENKIKTMRILILGAGAIGTHVLWGLITMGAQNITIIDFDVVEESNLNRQLFYGFDDIGRKKVDILKEKISFSYPEVSLNSIDAKIESENSLFRIITHDFVFKAFDTPKEGTEWVNAVCVRKKVPYISGGFLNENGFVGPVYIPDITPCYCCSGQSDGERYNELSPTFSPIVTSVASKMMLIFLDIALKNYDNISQYYFFNLYTSKWKEGNYEIKDKCSVCGKEAYYDILQLKTIIKYFAVALVGSFTAFLSYQLNNYNYNYIVVLACMIVFHKQVKRTGIIMTCTTILVSINTINYLILENIIFSVNDAGIVSYIQKISLIIVTICIMITLVSTVWLIFEMMLNKIERITKNVIGERYNKKI